MTMTAHQFLLVNISKPKYNAKQNSKLLSYLADFCHDRKALETILESMPLPSDIGKLGTDTEIGHQCRPPCSYFEYEAL